MKAFIFLSAAALITTVSGAPTIADTISLVKSTFPWAKPVVHGDTGVGAFGPEVKATDKVTLVYEANQARSLQKRAVYFDIWQGMRDYVGVREISNWL